MIKCEVRELRDVYGTGKFSEDKSLRVTFEMKKQLRDGYITFHESFGNKRRETPQYIAYQRQVNAKRIIEYIYYK